MQKECLFEMSHCFLCKTGFIRSYAVPLFKSTKTREFCGKSGGTAESIVLSDLIKSVGIKAAELHRFPPSFTKPFFSASINNVVIACLDFFADLSRLSDRRSTDSAIRLLQVSNLLLSNVFEWTDHDNRGS